MFSNLPRAPSPRPPFVRKEKFKSLLPVLASYLAIQLTQLETSDKGEPQLRVLFHQIDLWDIFFIDNCQERAQPTVGGPHPGQVALGV